MPLGSAYEQDAIDALANTPVVKPTPEPKFSAWSAVPRGLAVAAGEIGATAADTWGAFKAMRDATPAQRKQMDRTGVPVEAFSSELGDTVRSYWKDYKPDPVTASTAEQLLFGFTRGASKVVVGGLAAGPVGIGLAGLEEGVTQADELRLAGVDVNTRAKAGMVQGVGLAAAALPAVGQTALGTAGLYAIGGPGGFVAQQAATRHILQSAGYDRQAEQFDPFDPVGLAVATLLPAGFAAYGLRQQKLARAVAGLPDLPPRAADVPPAELAAPAPFPSRPSAVADAVRAYPTEVVDAAHVALLSERRAAANPGAPDSLRAMDQHETALARAEDQINAGEAVRVADVAPAIADPIPVLYPFNTRDTAPVGSWVPLPYPDARGQPIAQVREVPIADLYLPELDATGRLQPEKRSYLPDYTARAAAGEKPPNIDVVQMEDGRLRVVDGHRRVLAARDAGQQTIRATVSPLIDVPGEGKVPLTRELATQNASALGGDGYPAWADQITAAIRELQAQARPTDAPTTPQAANPEAAAPARGAGEPPAAAGAADAGRPAGVEAAGLTPEQARAAVETAKADVIALRKRESVLKSLLECLNG